VVFSTPLNVGINLGLNGSLEKFSPKLGTNSIWKKEAKISKLPKYLWCVIVYIYIYIYDVENSFNEYRGVKTPNQNMFNIYNIRFIY
jgi:hypothetical protein